MRAVIRPTGGRWTSLASTALRGRIDLSLSPALARLGLLFAPAMPAQAAIGCADFDNISIVVTELV
jgi:hypothetical protein